MSGGLTQSEVDELRDLIREHNKSTKERVAIRVRKLSWRDELYDRGWIHFCPRDFRNTEALALVKAGCIDCGLIDPVMVDIVRRLVGLHTESKVIKTTKRGSYE